MTEIKLDERGREQIPHWYAIAITTNKEKIIRGKIQELIKQKIWENQIFDVFLPSVIEKDAKGKDKEKIIYNQIGYVHMILNDDTWNALEVFRNSGFRGIMPGGSPMHLPLEEMEQVFVQIGRDLRLLEPTKQIEYENDDLEESEVVLFEKEKGNKELGVIIKVKEETYIIQARNSEGTLQEYELKKNEVEKVNE